MKVVFRTDASLEIGTGHVMRCLALADELCKKDVEVQFICRKHTGNLISYIESKGYVTHTLEVDENFSKRDSSAKSGNASLPIHAHWLASTQENDAQDCKLILQKNHPEWLVVDHYAIDFRWQKLLNKSYNKLMVIDDLADRKHECNILLDQTYGQNIENYKGLVPEYCQLLLGSQLALLRREFAQWREYSLKRRVKAQLKTILITMGGADSKNFTGKVLDELAGAGLSEDILITVVMGGSATNLEKVKRAAESMPYKVEVKVNVSNMAELMANSDLSIGAAGATTWERCCLGVPSILMIIADNQKFIASNLAEINAIECIDEASGLPLALKNVNKYNSKMSLISSTVTNGRGCESVIKYMFFDGSNESLIELRAVTISDCDYIYSLQTSEARKYARNPEKPLKQEHDEWFLKTIKSQDVGLFIIKSNQQQVGMIRFNSVRTQNVEVSIIVEAKFSGCGIAKRALIESFKLQPGKSFKAVVHRENLPSQRVFEKNGFNKVTSEDDFIHYCLHN